MKKYILSFLLFFFVSYFDYCFGVDVTGAEFSCLNSLATNTGGYQLASLSTTFCTTSGNACYNNGSISKISFTQKINYPISSNDFSCFPYVTYIQILNGSVFESFFTSFPPFVDELYIKSSLLSTFTVTPPKLRQLIIGGPFTIINASQLKNIKSFGLIESSQLLEIIPDYVEEDSILENMGFYTNQIPNISYFKNLKSFSVGFGDQFDESTYSNIQYFSQLESISFSGSSSPINFPYELTELVNPKYNSLQFWVKINSPPKLIDFSNNNQGKNVYVSFQSPGTNFNINGEFPISKLPTNCNHFETSNNLNFRMPDLNIFKNVSYSFFSQGTITSNITSSPFSFSNGFGMNSLKLKGTLDDSWCNTRPPSFVNNNLEGKLPDCFYCHLSGTNYISSLLSNNLFSNFNTTNSDCDYGQINVDVDVLDSNSLVIYGKNIGYDSKNIYTEPANAFSSTQFENGNFTTSFYLDAKNVTIKFKSQPKLSFTVSTSKTAPVIDSIEQVNTTITIQGSFFNNIARNIQVNIEGGLVCTVKTSSFYQIICSIDEYYPIKPWGNKLLSINVNSLLSSKSFNLKHTPIPCPVDDCNGNGVCNDHEGICECNQKWVSVDENICLVPNIFISSSSQINSNTGGTIKLFGWYGANYDDYIISVGNDTKSQAVFVSEDVLETTIAPGTGKVFVTLIMGPVVWEGYIYPYFEKSAVIECFNNCTSPSNGVCNTTSSECMCKPNFYGLDCSSYSPSTPITKLTTNAGFPISLTNEQTGFYISVVSINEYALNGTLVNTLTPTWQLNSNSNYISKLNDNVTNAASVSFTNYKNQNVSFVNNQFLIQNGVVVSFGLLNWNYQNNSNILQIVISSEIKIDDDYENPNNCNSDQTQLNSGSMIKSSSNVNFLKVSKNAKVFFARVYDKVAINGNPTQVETKIISSQNDKVLLGFNLPHTTSASLYSDFSLFIAPGFKTSMACDQPSSSSIVVYSGYLLISLIILVLI